jgi:hypothetical protein
MSLRGFENFVLGLTHLRSGNMISGATIRSALLVALAAKQTAAWGDLGHETIGYVAQQVRRPYYGAISL